jgi:hypothetical protein
MRRILIAAVLVAGNAFASQTFRRGEDWVRIFESPCVSAETLMRIDEASRKHFQKAQGVVNHERFFGCWRTVGDTVYIIWEDGDEGIVPKGDLKEDLEV